MPASIASSGLKAQRGKNLSLDVSRLEANLGYELPTIDNCIDQFYRDFHSGVPGRAKLWRAKPRKFPLTLIPYGKQWIEQDDVDAVVKVLKGGWITQGPMIEKFERSLAQYCGAKYAIAVNSGTAALHIACLAAGVKGGDEVITSPNTFVASANCAVYCGGQPVFADIDPGTYNISPV